MGAACEDSEEVTREGTISRDSVAAVLRAFRNHEHREREWNIVEVLEVLIDAGQFIAAYDLACNVAEIVLGDGRERLFKGYAVLCELMQSGQQSRCLEALERLYIEIHNGGHSVADRARIGLILARALALCVSVGSLSQRAILRARSILGVELERLRRAGDHELEAQVLTELAKCYLHAPTEDVRAAQALLEVFVQRPDFACISSRRAFDIKRVLFQAQKRLGADFDVREGEKQLRREAQSQGGVARALTELTIARGSVEIDPEQLERAATVLEANEFISGAFEARFVLATHAFERGHNVVAEREWRAALLLADTGGFLHGRLLGLLGLFQSCMLGEDVQQALTWLKLVEENVVSELALGSAGLNLAAAQQIIGDQQGALGTATRCEAFFKARYLIGFQAQAANIIGTCQAHAGRWKQAQRAWSRAADLDQERHAFVSACERRGLVAQAHLMCDLTSAGHVRPATITTIERMLQGAEHSLEPFGELDEAIRVRARLHSVRAHLWAVCGDHVRGMRYLSTARTLFAAIGQQVDVAMTDAFTGLSMLEVGKTANPGLAEEAVLHLQRSLQFFSSVPADSIRWKLLYYLAVAAVIVGQSKTSDHEKMKWRDLAAAWIRDAESECSREKGPGGGEDVTRDAYVGFSPGLKPEAIDELKSLIGLRGRPRKQREGSSALSARSSRYLH